MFYDEIYFVKKNLMDLISLMSLLIGNFLEIFERFIFGYIKIYWYIFCWLFGFNVIKYYLVFSF